MIEVNDYPLETVVAEVNMRLHDLMIAGHHAFVHQKWTCRHCGARQTMEEANSFHRSGRCEECDQYTVITQCNYTLVIEGGNR